VCAEPNSQSRAVKRAVLESIASAPRGRLQRQSIARD
jgi:hypothetical protein